MLRCYGVRNKLLGYLEGALSDRSRESLERHLRSCESCRKQCSEIEAVVKAAGQKRAPEMGDLFWQSFDRELDDKLLKRLEERWQPRHQVVPHLVRHWRPALVALSLSVLVMAIGVRSFLPKEGVQTVRMNQESLVDEALFLEEVSSSDSIALLGDEGYEVEMEVLYLLGAPETEESA